MKGDSGAAAGAEFLNDVGMAVAVVGAEDEDAALGGLGINFTVATDGEELESVIGPLLIADEVVGDQQGAEAGRNGDAALVGGGGEGEGGFLGEAFRMVGDDAWIFEVGEDFFALGEIAGPMNFHGDVAAGVALVDEVGGRDAVDPDFEMGAEGFDAEVVPFSHFECFASGRVIFHGVEPLPDGAKIFKNAAGPMAGGGIDFDHVAPELHGRVGECVDGAEGDAGVEVAVDFDIHFKDKIGECVVGADEGVLGGVGSDVADDFAVLHVGFSAAAFDGPAGEVLAVEEGGPGGVSSAAWSDPPARAQRITTR